MKNLTSNISDLMLQFNYVKICKNYYHLDTSIKRSETFKNMSFHVKHFCILGYLAFGSQIAVIEFTAC